eukprot:CAMPEP_0117015478 /NCGR_PEP_ID=MMETSP0472-20121206/12361_1 /TAXON_ID=693140 ORGANISM="Tiarina fusus, Strain LIS" /NCGR_SAMPLE_ID=MMETSP0472 /ASSEMBLY_ACC=CAM_ASM_000603 /LENGTH=752 /DNA_ID=CAMNT_0004719293 /DNA_START=87 /DNA_END=2345 /DNA_ORIENTATION=-
MASMLGKLRSKNMTPWPPSGEPSIRKKIGSIAPIAKLREMGMGSRHGGSSHHSSNHSGAQRKNSGKSDDAWASVSSDEESSFSSDCASDDDSFGCDDYEEGAEKPSPQQRSRGAVSLFSRGPQINMHHPKKIGRQEQTPKDTSGGSTDSESCTEDDAHERILDETLLAKKNAVDKRTQNDKTEIPQLDIQNLVDRMPRKGARSKTPPPPTRPLVAGLQKCATSRTKRNSSCDERLGTSTVASVPAQTSPPLLFDLLDNSKTADKKPVPDGATTKFRSADENGSLYSRSSRSGGCQHLQFSNINTKVTNKSALSDMASDLSKSGRGRSSVSSRSSRRKARSPHRGSSPPPAPSPERGNGKGEQKHTEYEVSILSEEVPNSSNEPSPRMGRDPKRSPVQTSCSQNPSTTRSRGGSSYLRGRRDKRASSVDRIRVSTSVERELGSGIGPKRNNSTGLSASYRTTRSRTPPRRQLPPSSQSRACVRRTHSSDDKLQEMRAATERTQSSRNLGSAASPSKSGELGPPRHRGGGRGVRRSVSGEKLPSMRSSLGSSSAHVKRPSSGEKPIGRGSRSSNGGGVRGLSASSSSHRPKRASSNISATSEHKTRSRKSTGEQQRVRSSSSDRLRCRSRDGRLRSHSMDRQLSKSSHHHTKRAAPNAEALSLLSKVWTSNEDAAADNNNNNDKETNDDNSESSSEGDSFGCCDNDERLDKFNKDDDNSAAAKEFADSPDDASCRFGGLGDSYLGLFEAHKNKK